MEEITIMFVKFYGGKKKVMEGFDIKTKYLIYIEIVENVKKSNKGRIMPNLEENPKSKCFILFLNLLNGSHQLFFFEGSL